MGLCYPDKIILNKITAQQNQNASSTQYPDLPAWPDADANEPDNLTQKKKKNYKNELRMSSSILTKSQLTACKIGLINTN